MIPKTCLMIDKVRGFKRQKNDNSTCDRKEDLFFFNVRGSPAFLTTDRLWGFALWPLRIPHQGDRIWTYGSLKLLHRLFGRILIMTYVTTVDNMPAFLTTDRLQGFALRPLRIPHQGDRIRTYGSLKLLHRLFRRIFLKRIVTTDDPFDWKVPRKNTIEQFV